MIKEQEALKLALEALEKSTKYFNIVRLGESRLKDTEIRGASHKAITAIKEALAQPARTGWPEGLLQDDDRKLSKWLASKPDAKHVVDMAQEPKIGCVQHDCAECKTRTAQQDAHKSMVEAASQQRPWVGLTEIDVLAESKHWRNPEDFLDGVYWAETTLKEKNT